MTDVAIIGAGPVGLLTAILFRLQGRSVSVFERRTAPSGHSRAIGIHPPSLVVLEAAGVVDDLVNSGVRITRGRAFSRGDPVAGLDFTSASTDFPFILSVPQNRTERVLEDRLESLAPGALQRGVEATKVEDDGGSVRISVQSPSARGKQAGTFQARIVVAANGAHSAFRPALDGVVRTRRYPDFYVMGDFRDDTGFGDDAVLFLEPAGIVECFPLPGGIRRWVVRLRAPWPEAGPVPLAELITRRTGRAVDPDSNSMVSAFGVTSSMVSRMVHGRVVLAGDAAHEISPIGGQGMNLGWLDMAAMVPTLGLLLDGRPCAAELAAVERVRHKAAKRAAWQAGLNMALGRPMPPGLLAARNRIFARIVEAPAVQGFVAKRFTMH